MSPSRQLQSRVAAAIDAAPCTYADLDKGCGRLLRGPFGIGIVLAALENAKKVWRVRLGPNIPTVWINQKPSASVLRRLGLKEKGKRNESI